MDNVNEIIDYFNDKYGFTERLLKTNPNHIYISLLDDCYFNKSIAYDKFIELIKDDGYLYDCLTDDLKQLINKIKDDEDDIDKFHKILSVYGDKTKGGC